MVKCQRCLEIKQEQRLSVAFPLSGNFFLPLLVSSTCGEIQSLTGLPCLVTVDWTIVWRRLANSQLLSQLWHLFCSCQTFVEPSFFTDNSKSVSFTYTFPGTCVYSTFCEWESRHVLFCYCPAKQQLKAAHSRLFLSTSRNSARPFPHCTSPSSYCVALLSLPVSVKTQV